MDFQIITLAVLLLGSATPRIRPSGTGTSPELDLNSEATLDAVFSNLPENISGSLFVKEPHEFREQYPGFFLGGDVLTGIRDLELNRPYQSFCRDHEGVIIFRVSATSPLILSVPWKSCLGHNGTVATVALQARFKGEISITSLAKEKEWKIVKLVPVLLEGLSVDLVGFGGKARRVVNVISSLFAGPVRRVWVDVVPWLVTAALDETAKELNVRL